MSKTKTGRANIDQIGMALDFLKAENKNLKSLLKRVEWSKIEDGFHYCHFCGRDLDSGHASYCKLVKAVG